MMPQHAMHESIPTLRLTHCNLHLFEYPETVEPYRLVAGVSEAYCPRAVKPAAPMAAASKYPAWEWGNGFLWWDSTCCETLQVCFRLLLVELTQMGWQELADEVHDEIVARARGGYSLC